MSEQKFTPGPWKLVPREVMEDDSVYSTHIVGGPREIQVCLLESFDAARRAHEHPEMRIGIFDANALLIAAAPDLLEALRLCFDHCRLYYPEVEHNNVGATVRAALAKAGEIMSLTYERTADYVLTLSDAGQQRLADKQRMQRLEPLYVKVKLGSLAGAVVCIAALVVMATHGG